MFTESSLDHYAVMRGDACEIAGDRPFILKVASASLQGRAANALGIVERKRFRHGPSASGQSTPIVRATGKGLSVGNTFSLGQINISSMQRYEGDPHPLTIIRDLGVKLATNTGGKDDVNRP